MPFDGFPTLCQHTTRIRRMRHPEQSRLWRYWVPGDFIDGYGVPSSAPLDEAVSLGLRAPDWVSRVMRLRNLVAGQLGLKQGSVNDGSSLFPTTFWSADERVLGIDDHHLNFRISIMRVDGMIRMATWVHPHNRLGRTYLRTVLPFHKLISRDALRRIARHHPG